VLTLSRKVDECKSLPYDSACQQWLQRPVASELSASCQGLTLAHFSAQRKYLFWDTLAGFNSV